MVQYLPQRVLPAAARLLLVWSGGEEACVTPDGLPLHGGDVAHKVEALPFCFNRDLLVVLESG